MKRKNIALIYILMLTFATLLSFITPKSEAAEIGKTQVIPKEAIRLRILANSNSQADQDLKRSVRDVVKADIDTWVANATTVEEARGIIQAHLQEIETVAKNEIEKAGTKQSVNVELQQADFPTKLYGDYLYPAGKYEAVVISLGEAEGNNWWCVLFPPLCFLDFGSGTAVPKKEDSVQKSEKKEKPVKVKFGIQSLFESLFG